MCFVNIFMQHSLTKYGFWCASKTIWPFPDFNFLYRWGGGTPPSLTLPPLGTSCLGQGRSPCLSQFTPPLPPNPGFATDRCVKITYYSTTCLIRTAKCLAWAVLIIGQEPVRGYTTPRGTTPPHCPVQTTSIAGNWPVLFARGRIITFMVVLILNYS